MTNTPSTPDEPGMELPNEPGVWEREGWKILVNSQCSWFVGFRFDDCEIKGHLHELPRGGWRAAPAAQGDQPADLEGAARSFRCWLSSFMNGRCAEGWLDCVEEAFKREAGSIRQHATPTPAVAPAASQQERDKDNANEQWMKMDKAWRDEQHRAEALSAEVAKLESLADEAAAFIESIKAEIHGHAPLYHGLKAGEKPKRMRPQEQVRWLAQCADELPIVKDKLAAAEADAAAAREKVKGATS